MPGKVFVSCGQSTDEERTTAEAVAQMLRGLEFEPYVATQIQTLLDLNGKVIADLKRSDYFLFINFRREQLPGGDFRGSLFTHQEAAIAYSLGFENMIFLHQEGVRSEGMMGFIVSNVPRFASCAEVVEAARLAIDRAGWVPSYSRNLLAQNLRWSSQIRYSDHTGTRSIQVLYVDIENRRPDIGAVGMVARLRDIVSEGRRVVSPDRSHLKATAYPGYEQTVFPGSHGAFDILTLELERPHTLTLNSALDVRLRQALIPQPGYYTFEYEVFAQGFPILTFAVDIKLLDRPVGRVLTAAEARLQGERAWLSSADAFRF